MQLVESVTLRNATFLLLVCVKWMKAEVGGWGGHHKSYNCYWLHCTVVTAEWRVPLKTLKCGHLSSQCKSNPFKSMNDRKTNGNLQLLRGQQRRGTFQTLTFTARLTQAHWMPFSHEKHSAFRWRIAAEHNSTATQLESWTGARPGFACVRGV